MFNSLLIVLCVSIAFTIPFLTMIWGVKKFCNDPAIEIVAVILGFCAGMTSIILSGYYIGKFL